METQPSASSSCPLRVWIVEDHVAIRELVLDFLAEMPGFKVVGAGENAQDAIDAATRGAVDLVILDLMLPGIGGINALDRFAALPQRPKILIFSAVANLQTVERCVRLGASGYVEKSAPLSHLQQALLRIQAGGVYFSEGVNEILRQLVTRAPNAQKESLLDERSLSLIRMICRGAPIKSIAAELGVSEPYVYRMRQNVLQEFGVNTDQELAIAALTMGFLELPPPPLRGVRSASQPPFGRGTSSAS